MPAGLTVMPTTTMYGFFAAFFILGAIASQVFWHFGLFLYRRGRTYLITVDGDSGTWDDALVRVDGNETTQKAAGRKQQYIFDHRSRLNHRRGKGPLHIVHRRHGWNLEAKAGPQEGDTDFLVPTDADTITRDPNDDPQTQEQKRRLAVLTIRNPALYHEAISRNKSADAVRANQEQPKPLGDAGPAIALFAGILALAGIAWIAWKVTQLLAAIGGG